MKDAPSSTPHAEQRRLAAIMFTDIVGFSRQMGADETRRLRLLDVHNQLIQHAVAQHHGTVIKTVGDAFLVDFPSVVNAVQCAQQVQAQLRAHNTDKENSEQIHVRIGIHSGDIVQRDGDVFGDGVNIASRLQGLAEPDSICISDIVYRDVAKKLDLGLVISLGRLKLKNIAERFQIYTLLPEAPTGLRQTLQVQRLKFSRRVRPVHRIVVAGVLLVAVTIGTVRYFPFLLLSPQHSVLITQEAQPPLPLPDKPSIVVLPFVNMSNDQAQEYFSDGLTEDLTSDLSQISSLFVISRNSAFSYKGKAAKVQDISKELGVQYVLEGSVRKVNDQVRITAQLIDAMTGYHLWSERYDRPQQDLFALQVEVLQKIVIALEVRLTAGEQAQLMRFPTKNLEAYDYFLRGLEYYYRFRKETNVQARQMFERALELDPQYAAAHAFLGWTHWTDWYSQWASDTQSLQQAFEAAQRAVTLDDSLPLAHMILGIVNLWKKQHEQALSEAEKTLALAPNEADGYWLRGFILNYMQRYQDALNSVEKAIRLNPHYPPYYLLELGKAHRFLGQPEKAITAQKEAIVRNPNFLPSHIQLAGTYSELGREEETRAEVAEIFRLSPTFSLDAFQKSVPYQDPDALRRFIDSLRKAGLK